MPPAAAIGAAAIGTIGSAIAGGKAAEAQGAISMAQMQEAQRTRALAQQAAEPSAAELFELQRQSDVSGRAIARQEELLKAVDPALIEAGQQALGLLRGEDAKSLEPVKRQRTRQRQLLENQLREQLGSGFSTSSAGFEALNRFDEQSADVLAGAQERTLNQLLGTARAVRPSQSELVGLAGAPLAAQQNIAQRRVGAILGTPTVGTAGGEHVGAFAGAQNTQNIFSGIAGLAGNVIGAGIGKGSAEFREPESTAWGPLQNRGAF